MSKAKIKPTATPTVEWANSLLDDMAAVIGFTPTVLMAALHGGNSLYIPAQAADGHPLVVLLGRKAFERFSAEWGGETIHVPLLNDFDKWRNCAMALAMHQRGEDLGSIARSMKVSKTHAQHLVQQAMPLRPRLRYRPDQSLAAWCRTRIHKASADDSVVDQAQQCAFDLIADDTTPPATATPDPDAALDA